jgi:hypothetical protein
MMRNILLFPNPNRDAGFELTLGTASLLHRFGLEPILQSDIELEAPSYIKRVPLKEGIRLAEMVADQRHYLAPLPEPQESERRTVLTIVADRLRSSPVTEGLTPHLKALEELELRSTGSWSMVASAQTEWITTAIRYLEACAAKLPADERPDPYWADDVVAGIIASARALIGVDELHARTEARYSGPIKRVTPEEEP